MSKPILVQIHIEWNGKTFTYTDQDGKPAQVEEVKLSDHDGFQWCSNSGGLEIHFNKNGTPFWSDPQRTVNIGCTGIPLTPKAAGQYDYALTLTDGAGQTHPVDPRIIIDPGVNIFAFWAAFFLFAVLGVGGVVFGLKSRIGARKRNVTPT